MGYVIAVVLSLPVLGVLGAVSEVLVYGGDHPGGVALATVLFGAVVAVGRAAVVPLVPGVRRRRAERARRRRPHGADFGVTDRPG